MPAFLQKKKMDKQFCQDHCNYVLLYIYKLYVYVYVSIRKFDYIRGAVAVGCWFDTWLPPAACRSVLEQETEPQIAPDEQLVPCMAAPTIGVCLCVYVCVCVHVASVVKPLEHSVDWKNPVDRA